MGTTDDRRRGGYREPLTLKVEYADAQDLIAETGVTYDLVLDSGGDHQLYGPIELALGLGGTYPVTVFIRPTGEIDSIKIGELQESEIREAIAEARS